MRETIETPIAAGDALTIAGRTLRSRLLLGSGGFASLALLAEAIAASGCELVTVALRRVDPAARGSLIDVLADAGVELLPNTAGCHHTRATPCSPRAWRARLSHRLDQAGGDRRRGHAAARCAGAAARREELVDDGFVVLPYTTDDSVLARRLADMAVPP